MVPLIYIVNAAVVQQNQLWWEGLFFILLMITARNIYSPWPTWITYLICLSIFYQLKFSVNNMLMRMDLINEAQEFGLLMILMFLFGITADILKCSRCILLAYLNVFSTQVILVWILSQHSWSRIMTIQSIGYSVLQYKTKSWQLQMMVPELQSYREMVIWLSKSLWHLRTQ